MAADKVSNLPVQPIDGALARPDARRQKLDNVEVAVTERLRGGNAGAANHIGDSFFPCCLRPYAVDQQDDVLRLFGCGRRGNWFRRFHANRGRAVSGSLLKALGEPPKRLQLQELLFKELERLPNGRNLCSRLRLPLHEMLLRALSPDPAEAGVGRAINNINRSFRS